MWLAAFTLIAVVLYWRMPEPKFIVYLPKLDLNFKGFFDFTQKCFINRGFKIIANQSILDSGFLLILRQLSSFSTIRWFQLSETRLLWRIGSLQGESQILCWGVLWCSCDFLNVFEWKLRRCQNDAYRSLHTSFIHAFYEIGSFLKWWKLQFC